MEPVMAIDPGEGGGIAWRDREEIVHAENMPGTMPDMVDRIRSIVVETMGVMICWVEKTGGYMPGNSGPSAAKFARHCGSIETALYALGVPVFQVAPSVWMKKLGTFPKDKKARKNAIKAMMQTRYPHLRVTLKTSDALGILTVSDMGQK